MKKSFLTALLSVILLSVATQSRATAPEGDAFDTQMKVYGLALKYYDLQTATSALYNAMVLKPERKDLRDSLTNLYFIGERYGQAYTLGEEILKEDPKRTEVLAIVAVSKQSLGFAKEALADYEKLYAGSKQVEYLYQIATLQYQLKRFGECIVSIDQLLADESSAKQNVTMRQNNGASQNVPLRAAALNVKGIVAIELNQQANAKEFFNQALKLFPDFTQAKINLQYLDKQGTAAPASTGSQAAKPAATTPKK